MYSPHDLSSLAFFPTHPFWSATTHFVNEPETLASGFDGGPRADV
jgi:hypothetical protein